jgi:hypothetical protein
VRLGKKRGRQDFYFRRHFEVMRSIFQALRLATSPERMNPFAQFADGIKLEAAKAES